MQRLNNALAAGKAATANNETSAAGTARGLGDQGKTTSRQYVADAAAPSTSPLQNLTPPPEASPSDAKRWAMLQARCALVGLAVTRTEDDAGRPAYIASKWALTRQCASLDEVEKLLRSIGGPAA